MTAIEFDVENFMAHHGVKGMKWGVRKDKSPAPVTSVKTPGASSTDAKRANKLQNRAQTHGTGNLSNKEMRDLIDRMNLEQQYSRLSTHPERQSKGSMFAKALIKKVGPTLLVTGLTAIAEKSGDPKNIAAAKVVGLAIGAKSLTSAKSKKKG